MLLQARALSPQHALSKRSPTKRMLWMAGEKREFSHLWSLTALSKRLSNWRVVNFRIATIRTLGNATAYRY